MDIATLSTRVAVLEERVAALKELTEQRFSGADKANAAAFTASNTAILKAEDAQKGINAGQNEFRGTLKDQQATLIPRAEVDRIVEALEAKIDDLRASRDTTGGSKETARVTLNTVLALAAVAVAVVSMIVAYLRK